MFSILKAADLN